MMPPARASACSASSRDAPRKCMTIASFTVPPARSSNARASSRVSSHTSAMMRSLRSSSFLFVARRSTMRLPYVLPSRIIAPLVMVLSTSFVAVPAFIRVEPVTTSGPVIGRIRMSTYASVSSGGGEQATRSEEHTSELQSHVNLVCRLLLEKKKKKKKKNKEKINEGQKKEKTKAQHLWKETDT